MQQQPKIFTIRKPNANAARLKSMMRKLQGECQRLVDLANDFLRFARIKEVPLEPRGWESSSRR